MVKVGLEQTANFDILKRPAIIFKIRSQIFRVDVQCIWILRTNCDNLQVPKIQVVTSRKQNRQFHLEKSEKAGNYRGEREQIVG